MSSSDDFRPDSADDPRPRGTSATGSAAHAGERLRHPVDPAAQRWAVAALLLSLLSLAGILGLHNLSRGVYLIGLALITGLIAIGIGLGAFARSRRVGARGPRGAVTAAVIGAVGVVLSGILLAGFAILGTQISTYSRCLSGANTLSAQQSCQSQFRRAVNNKIGKIRSGAGRNG